MVLDWTISVGNLLTIASFIGGGMWFIMTMRTAVRELALRLQYVEASNDDQKEEIKKLGAILITLGRYEERFLRVEQQIDELRHGRGFINPRP